MRVARGLTAAGCQRIAAGVGENNKAEALMTVKVELTSDVQAGLLAQAQASGLSLETYVEQVLREQSRAISGPPLTRSQIAGQRIRELRKGVTLGGISIRDLIEEGRE